MLFRSILLLGDHVLFDITPNITVWPSYANPLGGYLDSLALVRRLPVRLPLPAHRTVQTGLRERIDEITAHHKMCIRDRIWPWASTLTTPPWSLPTAFWWT